jgi:hypothetical protein
MTHAKNVEVRMSGTGETRQATVQPGMKPREVLAQAVGGNPENYLLRDGTQRFDDQADVHQHVDTGQPLIGATDPVEG